MFTQPPYTQLRSWLVNYATHYSAISRLELETLGYNRLGEAEKQAIMAILDNLEPEAKDVVECIVNELDC